jgi:sulfite exporter TauE/SafE
MLGFNPLPLFFVGLLGSVHCAGMCGGIVGALSLRAGRRPAPFPVPVKTVAAAPVRASLTDVLAYNTGRIGSYGLAGLLAGGAGQGARGLAALPALQAGAYWLANGMLVALGLYLMGAWLGLARLEQGGQVVWRRVQPLLRRLGPPAGPARMLAVGSLWGWLPCGMVYSALVTSMLSGSALAGMLAMLAFGLGTLPMLLALGLTGTGITSLLRARAVRMLGGALVLGFGVAGLARAAGGTAHAVPWMDMLCLSAAGLR